MPNRLVSGQAATCCAALLGSLIVLASYPVNSGRARAQCAEGPAEAAAPAKSKTPPGKEAVRGDQKSAPLEVLEIKFDPIHKGMNVVHVKVKNVSAQEQVFGIQVQSQSRFGGFGKAFSEKLAAGETKWTRFEFDIAGPITDARSVRLQFYNPPSAEKWDLETWFKQVTYDAGDLEHRNLEEDRHSPATESQRQAFTKVLEQMRSHVKQKDVDAAWGLLGDRCRKSMGRDKFKQAIEDGVFAQIGFFDFRIDSIVQHFGYLRVEASHEGDIWLMELVEKDGQHVIDYMRWIRDARDWKERLLPNMQKHSTAHFDIYCAKGSTADGEIEQIAARREEAFRDICAFLDEDSDLRICMVFFESGAVKAAETGHQGAGWAQGNTLVEVYNPQEKLDPYHEMVHVLMGPHGSPPAALNEGFAVFMTERLGAKALTTFGGGQSSVHERVKELKGKEQWIPLKELLTYTEIGSESSRYAVSYPEAASFVKFLIDAYGKDKFLRVYKTMRNSRDGAAQQENVKTIEQAYSRPLEELEKEWEKAFSALPAARDPSAGSPGRGTDGASPDNPASARDKVAPGLPEDFHLGEHFYFYGSGGIDYGALNDPVNDLILKACVRAASGEDLRPLGIVGLQERLGRLEAGRLIQRTDNRYVLAFPAVVGAKRSRLQEHAEKAAARLLPLARKTADRVQGRLKDRKDMVYHVLWSVVMDGSDAWEASKEELRRQVRTGDTSMDNKGWVIYPDHASAVGTNSYDQASGHLRITWARGSPKPAAIRETFVRHEGPLTDAIRKNLPLKAGPAREALAAWGLVDEAGNVRLLVLDSKRDAAILEDYRKLGREFGRELAIHLDAPKTAEMLEAPPGVALLIAYHEICWQLLQNLTDEGVLKKPDVLSQGESRTKEGCQLISLVAAAPDRRQDAAPRDADSGAGDGPSRSRQDKSRDSEVVPAPR